MKINNKNIKGKVGFEVECVFSRLNSDKVELLCRENNWKFDSDPSIQNTRKYPNKAEIKFNYSIEELNEKLPIIQKLFSLIESNTKKYNCGLHTHVSFENTEDYFKLCTFDFAKHFQDLYLKKCKTQEDKFRLQKNWCQFYKNQQDFTANVDSQLRARDRNNRYFVINYNSFNRFKTIEFRIFAGTNKISKLVRNCNLIFESINSFNHTPIEFVMEREEPKKNQKVIINKQLGFSKNMIIPVINNISTDEEDEDNEDEEEDEDD